MDNAYENLVRVIRQSGDQKNNSARLIEESNRQADAVVAFLTSDEAVERTAKVVAFAASDWTHNDCGSDEHAFEHSNWEPYVDDARAAILAALGVESLPRDPVSEAELICGDYPAPCNHNPAHKKGAE